MTCPRCNNKHMDRNEDNDWSCWNCRKVVYLNVVELSKRDPQPGTRRPHRRVRPLAPSLREASNSRGLFTQVGDKREALIEVS